jgi:hypothetical protein
VHLRRGAGGGDIAEHRRRWRRKDAAFAKECDAAIEMAGSHVEVLAWERGVTGIEEPIWHYSKLVGTRIKRSTASSGCC